jgi:short-subunit dehydrogenase
MCYELASQGFNICIVARNPAKISERLTDIEREYKETNPNIKTMKIVADFSKITSIDHY